MYCHFFSRVFSMLTAIVLLCTCGLEVQAQEKYYSLQFNSFLNKAVAEDNYRILVRTLPEDIEDLRLEKTSTYFVLRAGLYQTYSEGRQVYEPLRPLHADLILIQVVYDPERIVLPQPSGKPLQLSSATTSSSDSRGVGHEPSRIAINPLSDSENKDFRTPVLDEAASAEALSMKEHSAFIADKKVQNVNGSVEDAARGDSHFSESVSSQENSTEVGGRVYQIIADAEPSTLVFGWFEQFSVWLSSLALDTTLLLAAAGMLLVLLLLLASRGRFANRKTSLPPPAEPRPAASTGPSRLPGLKEEKLREQLRVNIQQISTIYTNIHSVDKMVRSIYVTSCFHGEGKTTSAVQLAYGLAMNNNVKVLLLDANPRAARLHEVLELDPTPGLLEILRQERSLHDCIQHTFLQGIDAIPFGDPQGRRPDLLRFDRLRHEIANLKDNYNYIVVDGNSYLASPDSPLVANCFGGCVLIVEAEKTKWEVVQQAVSKMQMMESKVLGAVLNKRKFYIPRLIYERSK